MTPETATTTHYFWAFGRNYRLDDAALSNKLHANIRRTFEEDVEIVEAQQRAGGLAGLQRIDVNADTPTIQARRLVAQLIAAEHGR